MTELGDRELVKRCQGGDQEAFRDLVERYRDVVFGLITRTTRDPARSEELAQEAFLRVYRGLPHFRGEARLVTWIYRIVANLCIEERGRRPADTMSLDEVDEHQQPRIQPSGPDREFSDLELRDRRDARAFPTIPDADRGALSQGGAIRRPGRGARRPARDGEDAALSSQAPAPCPA